MPVIIALIVIGLVIWAIVLIVIWFVTNVLPWILLATTVSATCVGVYVFIRSCVRVGQARVSSPTKSLGEDPASVAYLFGPVIDDLRAVFKGSMSDTLKYVTDARDFAESEEGVLFVLGFAWTAFLFLFGLLSVALSWMLAVILIVPAAAILAFSFCILFIADRFTSWARSHFTACPMCDTKNVTLHYECRSCGSRHRNLYPNRMGALYHLCECGQKIPAHIFTGRGIEDQAFCSNEAGDCNHQIGRQLIESREVNLPLVGGPSSGKTILMVAILNWWMAYLKSQFDSDFEFDANSQKSEIQMNINALKSGQLLEKTEAIRHRAITFVIKPKGQVKKAAYLFDVAGETYTDANLIEEQRHLRNPKAIILAFDPFSLPSLRAELDRVGNQTIRREVAPCEVNVDLVVSSLISAMERSGFVRNKENKFDAPIYVFVTKTDALKLQGLIDNQTGGGDQDARVRRFLLNSGAGPALRLIDANFSAAFFYSGAPLTLGAKAKGEFNRFMSAITTTVLAEK